MHLPADLKVASGRRLAMDDFLDPSGSLIAAFATADAAAAFARWPQRLNAEIKARLRAARVTPLASRLGSLGRPTGSLQQAAGRTDRSLALSKAMRRVTVAARRKYKAGPASSQAVIELARGCNEAASGCYFWRG